MLKDNLASMAVWLELKVAEPSGWNNKSQEFLDASDAHLEGGGMPGGSALSSSLKKNVCFFGR
jgi:hypothetical protein